MANVECKGMGLAELAGLIEELKINRDEHNRNEELASVLGDPFASGTLALKMMREKGDFSPVESLAKSLNAPDCQKAYEKGWRQNGLYQLYKYSEYNETANVEDVLCHQEEPEGGWRVIQQRTDGSVDFYRKWKEYRNGFGDLTTEFWLGLDKIYELTKNRDQMLRIEMVTDGGNEGGYVQYEQFWLSDAKTNFVLHVNGSSGYRAGNGMMTVENGMMFSTKDRDNDRYPLGNLAVMNHAGWWHNGEKGGKSYSLNANGRYDEKTSYPGLKFWPWNGDRWTTLCKVKLMIRKRSNLKD